MSGSPPPEPIAKRVEPFFAIYRLNGCHKLVWVASRRVRIAVTVFVVALVVNQGEGFLVTALKVAAWLSKLTGALP